MSCDFYCPFFFCAGGMWFWFAVHQRHCKVARLCAWFSNSARVCSVWSLRKQRQACQRIPVGRQWIHASRLADDSPFWSHDQERKELQLFSELHKNHCWTQHWNRKEALALPPASSGWANKSVPNHNSLSDVAQQSQVLKSGGSRLRLRLWRLWLWWLWFWRLQWWSASQRAGTRCLRKSCQRPTHQQLLLMVRLRVSAPSPVLST